jgi:glycosyltransferase involved in cell wall biosynthesis
MRLLRVLMLTDHYPPSQAGGSSESVRLEAEGLAKAGHTVTVLTPRWIEESSHGEIKYLNDGAVSVIRFPAPKVNRERSFWYGWLQQMTEEAELLLGGTHQHNFDVVHAQEWRSYVAMTHLNRKHAAVRQVATLRDVGLLCPIAVCLLSKTTVPSDCGYMKLATQCIPEMTRLYGGHRAYAQRGLGFRLRRLALRRLGHTSAVLFPSQALYHVYDRQCGLPPYLDQALIVPSAVSPDEPDNLLAASLMRDHLHLLDHVPTVLYVGKPSPGKGWGLFVEAARQWNEKARFVHIGHKPSLSARYIEHLGPQSRATVLLTMRASTVVMVPPLQCDTLPRTALEALSQERYVVGTDRGGLPEIIKEAGSYDREYGTCVPPEQVVGAIGGVLHKKWPWNVQGSYKSVQARFGQERVAKLLSEVYDGRR